MIEAEHALHEAAAHIPSEVSGRFETAEKLSDEDRKAIIEIAQQALAPFQTKPESNPDLKAGSKSDIGPKTRAKPHPETHSDSNPEAKDDGPTHTEPKPPPEAKAKS